MADSNATYNTSIAVDLPDFPAGTVLFTLDNISNQKPFFVGGNNESFPRQRYTLTLDANGQGTQVLPTPDNTGTAAANWRINLPNKQSYTAAIAYSASTQQLSDILASVSTTTDPDTITAALAGKVSKSGDTMTGNLTMDTGIDIILSASSEISGSAVTVTTTSGSNGDITLNPDGTGIISAASTRITSLADATAATDAMNQQASDARYVNVTGDTMTGDLTMGSGTQIIARTGTATDPSIRGSGSSNTGVNISGTTVEIVSEGAVIAAFKDITFPDTGRELDLYGGKIFNYGEYSSSRSISSGALSFPVDTNNVFTVLLNQNVTSISITWPDDIEACSFEVYYTQDATGGRTVSHTGMKGRDSGTAPDISTTANAVSRVVYSTPDGGTTVYADLVGKDYGTIS